MHSIKQASEYLRITPQAIYKRSEELTQKGYMKRTERNQIVITDEGLNYLKDGLIEKANLQSTLVSKIENKVEQTNVEAEPTKEDTIPFKEVKTSSNDIQAIKDMYNNVIEFYKIQTKQLQDQVAELKEQIAEQKEQVNYFKTKFEEKDRLYTEVANQKLLGVAEEHKKTWLQKLLNR